MIQTNLANDEQKKEKNLLEHFEDLRIALAKSLLAIVVSSIVCFYFADKIIYLLEEPLLTIAGAEISRQILRALSPHEAFLVSIKVVIVAGIIVASPVISYQLWNFISPGMTSKERSFALKVLVIGSLCFLLGIVFSYFVVLKACLSFLWNYTIRMGIKPEWTIGNYMSFVSILLLAFGVTFEMPAVSALLAKLNLLNSKTLSGKRLPAILIMFIIAAVLTPPDIFSQLLLAIPMILLYEISILIVKFFNHHA